MSIIKDYIFCHYGSRSVLANAVKFSTCYSHSRNFTGTSEARGVTWNSMTEKWLPSSTEASFVFLICSVSGCVWFPGLALERARVRKLGGKERWSSVTFSPRSDPILRQPPLLPKQPLLLRYSEKITWVALVMRRLKAVSQTHTLSSRSRSETPPHKAVSLVFLPWSRSRQQQRSGFHRSALFHPNTSSIHTLIGLFNNDVWL